MCQSHISFKFNDPLPVYSLSLQPYHFHKKKQVIFRTIFPASGISDENNQIGPDLT